MYMIFCYGYDRVGVERTTKQWGRKEEVLMDFIGGGAGDDGGCGEELVCIFVGVIREGRGK